MSFRVLIAAAAALSLMSCKASEAPPPEAGATARMAPILDSPDAVDVHSFAKPLEARVTHVALDLGVDFATKRIGGTATLDLQAKPDAKEIILDDKGLEIEAITDTAGKALSYKVGAVDPTLGAPLSIAMGDARKIVIRYKSAPDSGALQWLTPEQTAGKKQPFLFSQGQAIENRSWIPTQDSPGIRQTWEAKIRVDQPLTAVMSAPRSGEPTEADGKRVFSFGMDKPVAPYLIAIAVGDLAFKDLGPRTGVWAEPVTLPEAATELADTEKMVTAAEALYGPYQWGRYDMLVLPPSFPFGGMENPTLTFLTPTFIAGDKSLVSLIAHELAHSWSGNLATNATWADFWLNEGMTTYAERRIVEEVYGPKVAAQQVALGVDAMNKGITDNGGAAGADTRLHIDLKGRHPDDGLTDIAYEKGAAFLRTIEATVGRERFDAWLKGWFERHEFQPVTSAIFLSDIREHLVRGDQALEAKLQLDRWVNDPGVPDNVAKPDPAAFAAVDAAVAAFAGGTLPAETAWSGWTTDERLRFLNRLDRKQSADRLAALDRTFGLSRSGNMELRFAFLDLAVRNRFDPAVPALEEFLTVQGRRKFVRPLITALAEDATWGRRIAARIYAKTRPLYHPVTTRDLDKLGLGSPEASPNI
ncbi:M1 family metallopeptidase [Sphingomonas sp. LY29]|uniref:M1 family metallopeptidase n=1 Tax=Sphingomonas sp. LY29 TaxID=3095341 RepID=UPI002D78EC1B|nr:M1 family metallopeptidase [Sphingomonas sp. LY29]WRP24670.1 M1 family metallopeptidase [Sphingomonas sp. LY29]